tara:strand:- start:552 stop:701 length:150 start_codon:yes stop_codon:yes gene_type:complete
MCSNISIEIWVIFMMADLNVLLVLLSRAEAAGDIGAALYYRVLIEEVKS